MGHLSFIEVALLSSLVGGVSGLLSFFVFHFFKKNKVNSSRVIVQEQAKSLLSTSLEKAKKTKEQADIRTQAEIKIIRRDFENSSKSQLLQFQEMEKTLEQRQRDIDQRSAYLESRLLQVRGLESQHSQKKDFMDHLENQYTSICDRFIQDLEAKARCKRASLQEDIRNSLLEAVRHDEAKLVKAFDDEVQASAQRQAKRIMSYAMNRFSGDPIGPKPKFVLPLSHSKLKGKIIGRMGRNIKTFQTVCGVELTFEDQDRSVTVVSQDSFKKEIARRSLLRLMREDHFNPQNIEVVILDVEKKLIKKALEDGKLAFEVLEMGTASAEIYEVSGRLKYRYSYNQNIYHHSIEMGFLAGFMAAELGENVLDARRASFLHDIGKVLMDPGEGMGGHAVIGAEYSLKYGEKEHIAYAVGAHHDEYKPKTVLDDIVKAADALSGGRPGARVEAVESFVERVDQLIAIATSYDGVTQCYAMHAGRELRVYVDALKVADAKTQELAQKIARRVEDEMVYPGQIKVIVIRENVATGTAF
ncbi:MAG: DUF3552 domain-containing protein [Deltaproteobacteria bacterium]|nr:DUF3552 domain-containing protein [Deltaproteobacteria bacterium]